MKMQGASSEQKSPGTWPLSSSDLRAWADRVEIARVRLDALIVVERGMSEPSLIVDDLDHIRSLLLPRPV